MQILSAQDKEFIKRIEAGEKKSPAFRAAYPEHPATIAYWTSTSGSPERQKAVETLVNAARTKLNAQYISGALTTYQDKMEEFSKYAVDTAIELVKGARSEKVRADLAIEGIRHKVGTPVTKVAVKEERVVTLTFGAPPKDERSASGSSTIEGEVIQNVLESEDVLGESSHS